MQNLTGVEVINYLLPYYTGKVMKKNLLGLLRARQAETKSTAQIEREIVQKYARGNINLQAGRYQTQADLDKAREEILSYRFE